MGFDWSTFTLEVVNFLILVWILTHYFYRPVAAVIERRREAIENRLQRAERLQSDAEAMRRQYEARLADWEQEKRQLREFWLGELAAEKARQIDALRQSLAAERQQAEVLEQRRLRAREAELEQAALSLAGGFAGRLLERLAGPELESRLVDLFIADLADVPPDRWPMAAAADLDQPGQATVASAFPLAELHRSRLQRAVSERLGRPITCRFVEDPTLIAGLRFELGPLSLGANLRDELAFFGAPG